MAYVYLNFTHADPYRFYHEPGPVRLREVPDRFPKTRFLSAHLQDPTLSFRGNGTLILDSAKPKEDSK